MKKLTKALAAASAIVVVVGAFTLAARREPRRAAGITVQPQPATAGTATHCTPAAPGTLRAALVAPCTAPAPALPAIALAAAPRRFAADYQLASDATGSWANIYSGVVHPVMSSFDRSLAMKSVTLPTGSNIRQVWSFVFNAPTSGAYLLGLHVSVGEGLIASSSVEIDGVPHTTLRVTAGPRADFRAAKGATEGVVLDAGWHRARVTLESPVVDLARPVSGLASAMVFMRAPGDAEPAALVTFVPRPAAARSTAP